MPRLFVALPLPDDVLDGLAALPRTEEKGVRWTRREHWHVTLRFLGECALDEVVRALDGFAAASPTVTVGPEVSRLGRNVVCVPIDGVAPLAAAVADATADLGEPPDPRPFRGHVTLARLKHRGACGVAGLRFSSSFVADRIQLVESTLRPDGPLYETRLEVPLSPSSSA